jgi:hypothetical protein
MAAAIRRELPQCAGHTSIDGETRHQARFDSLLPPRVQPD